MLKKTFLVPILFAVASLTTSPAAAVAMAGSFSDVPATHSNYEAIEYLKKNDILHGYSDGTFGPENPVLRGEAVKIVLRAFDISFDEEYEVLFPDVLEDDWFFPYVMAAQKAGILSGYKDGTFKPANQVNLAESLKIALLAAGFDTSATTTYDVFADVLASDWYSPYALFAREKNIILGDEENKVYPGTAMTRAKFAELIYRSHVVKQNNNKPFSLSTNWREYESTRLPFSMKFDEDNWQLIENDDEVIFFKPDKQLGQFAPVRIYPNSAIVRVTVDDNALALDTEDYFENIKEVFPGASFKNFTLDGLKALEVSYAEMQTIDWYIYLPNDDDKVLAIFTEYGDGVLSYQLPKIIKEMLGTLEYLQVDDDMIDLSTVFENILVEGKGKEMLDALWDSYIIETDAIGVGTGPVDYYYTGTYDYTFKYERASDVILDKREGKTSAF